MNDFTQKIENLVRKSDYRLWLLLTVTIGCLLYLTFSKQVIGLGFPLDDAWIHQTYARNLYQTGKWIYSSQLVSGGSTSPLWSILLVVGHIIKTPILWSYVLGLICLVCIASISEIIFQNVTNREEHSFPFFGLFVATEWHFLWASLSGMETLLFTLGIVLIFYLLLFHPQKPFWVGVVCGISIWVRPEALTFLGPSIFVLFFIYFRSMPKFGSKLVGLLSGFVLTFIPYLIFNYILAGSIFPNTFNAKRAEYLILLDMPLYSRVLELIKLPLIGSGVLLLPGFLYQFWKSIHDKNWYILSAYIWWGGIVLIYALNLPVVYQHGRYLIPSMVIFYLTSLIGVDSLVIKLKKNSGIMKRISTVWLLCIVGVQLSFLALGAKTYANDVTIIETEMVASASWIAENTENDALIAAHDIGALGYYGDRRIVDLAGLIDPEVIPIIRDEQSLSEFMDDRGVDYLMTFPSWYPKLIQNKQIVFQTNAVYAPEAGRENMSVYIWK